MGVLGGLLLVGLLIIVVAYIAQPFVISNSLGSGRRILWSSGGILRERAALLAERNALYRQIRDLDFDHTTGKITDEDYTAQRYKLVARGVEVLQQLDTLSADELPENDPLEAMILALRKPEVDITIEPTACLQCGAVISTQDRFCGNCGIELLSTEGREGMAALRCPSCGVAVGLDDRFCGKCGAHLEHQE